MHTLRYVVCDVFTDRELAGNPVAVFTDARKLQAPAMQALAREMNLSESVFVLRATSGGHARIRIFTPTRELPFAGHPILGSAFVLGGPMQQSLIRIETGAGVIPVELEREGARIVFGRMQQPNPRWAPLPDPQPLLGALGVARSELPIEVYDLGPRHVFVALPSAAAVAGLAPDFNALARAGDFGVNTFARSEGGWKTRMFAPRHGVNEDPATGSAAGPLAVHLLRHGLTRSGEEISIEQGAEIGRPSRLYARARGTPAAIESVEVGGCAVVVAHGEFRLRSV